MKLTQSLLYPLAVSFVACSHDVTAPPPPLQFSVATPTTTADSVSFKMTANQPVRLHQVWGVCPSYNNRFPAQGEIGPVMDYSWSIPVQALETYCDTVWVTTLDGRESYFHAERFTTPDYEPCDARNTTAKKVPVTVTYTPPTPNPYVLLGGVEVLDCAGRSLTDVGSEMLSADGGRTYTFTWQLPVNYPTGSKPHSFRAMRALYGRYYDGWAEGANLRFNGVMPVNHSDSLPPPYPCDPTVGCQNGVRWYFTVDSSAVVHP